MPTLKEFQGKKQSSAKSKASKNKSKKKISDQLELKSEDLMGTEKRRPFTEPQVVTPQAVESEKVAVEEETKVETELNVAAKTTETESEPNGSEAKVETQTHDDNKPQTITLDFAGAEKLRQYFPQSVELAEKVATDWAHDGQFEGLPVGHPLAQYFVAKGLRRAKQVEKEVVASAYYEKAKEQVEKVATQAFLAAMKANEVKSQVEEKVKGPLDLVKSILGKKK